MTVNRLDKRLQANQQAEAFRRAAMDLGCDANEGAFNVALGKIVRAKPSEPPVKKRKAEKVKPAK